MKKPLKFKFMYLNKRGGPCNWFCKKGRFDGETLTLHKTHISAEDLLGAEDEYLEEKKRVNLLFTFRGEAGDIEQLKVCLKFGPRRKLVKAVNATASKNAAKQRLLALKEQGDEGAYRIVECPHCDAAIDVTGYRKTAETYCHYCDTVINLTGRTIAHESHYRVCGKCGYYSHQRMMTTFYFYYIKVVWGFGTDVHIACDHCLRKEALMIFVRNIPFIIGVPFALFQLLRLAFSGISSMHEPLAQLDEANALAKRRKTEAASRVYTQIENTLGSCAGVRTNHGWAFERAEMWDQAIIQYKRALQDCSNYFRAYEALWHLYDRLDRTCELEALDSEWEDRLDGVVLSEADR